MISGLGISSGIASAVRTADKARATMDDMSRQIATGKRVSSVKDDGAAWARAAGMRSQAVVYDVNEQRLGMYRAHHGLTKANFDALVDILDRARGLFLRGSQTSPGSSSRAALAAEWDALMSEAAFVGDRLERLTPGDGPLAFNPAVLGTTDGLLAGLESGVGDGDSIEDYVDDLAGMGGLTGADFLARSAAALATEASLWDLNTQTLRSFGARIGRQQALANRIESQNATFAAQLHGAIGSLTDVDLGKASTARARADTRQQLALATIQQAISAYGNYAGGLLGNVQRTQRGVLA